MRDVYAFVAFFSLWDGDGLRDALSWWGFGAVSLLLLVGGGVLLVQEKARLGALLRNWHSVPVLAFMAVCIVSVSWSDYPVLTLVGCFIQIGTSVIAIALVVS